MKDSIFVSITGSLFSFVLLTACTNSEAPYATPPGTSFRSNSISRDRASGASWIDRDAAKGALLYIEGGGNTVLVYSYPQLKLVGKLTGFEETYGECVDRAGNVWIADWEADKIIEYAHGATKPKVTLTTPTNQSPYGCSVDPKTGNLAVAAQDIFASGPGYTFIFTKAKGTPKSYSDANFLYEYFAGYDGKGNLFIDGNDSASGFEYAELAKAHSKLKSIALKAPMPISPGNIQFDGKYMAVGSEESQSIFRTLGSKVVGTTTLTGAGTIQGFFIDGTVLIAGDQRGGTNGTDGSVELYKYPAGGSPIKSINIPNPYGVAVSNK